MDRDRSLSPNCTEIKCDHTVISNATEVKYSEYTELLKRVTCSTLLKS